jgi:sec-independent protein translocase protein TatC
MGMIFLFPIVVYFLTSIGLFTPTFLKTYRRHSIVLILVVAALVTPADVFSMLAAALPLLLLFEFSVLMSKRVYKRIQKEEAIFNAGKTNLEK